MREISLNARRAFNDQQTEEVGVLLITITHDDLDDPIQLSTDPTDLLSEVDELPRRFGTRSRGEEYNFILVSALLPDEPEAAPPTASIVLSNVVPNMSKVVRSVNSPASVTLEFILASSPDSVEYSWSDLRVVNGEYDSERITISLSAVPATSEPYPSFRMTKSRFPGLFR